MKAFSFFFSFVAEHNTRNWAIYLINQLERNTGRIPAIRVT
jgi:hypothetical protein